MTEGFFPGSSQPITSLAPPPDYLPEGKTYQIAGRDVELFSIAQVAAALNRKPVTIRKWERDKIIPVATFVKRGVGGDVRGKRRLYSRAQVEAMVKIAAEEGILHNLKAQISKTRFAARTLAAFKQIASQP